MNFAAHAGGAETLPHPTSRSKLPQKGITMRARNRAMAVVAIAPLAVAVTCFVLRDTRAPEPQDICEAVEIIERMGLFWTTGSETLAEPVSGYSTITIAAAPITREQAGELAVGQSLAQWRGKARAYSGTVAFGPSDDRLRYVLWGKVTLVGDPDLVDRIVRQ
jgi:hypothetical protein